LPVRILNGLTLIVVFKGVMAAIAAALHPGRKGPLQWRPA